MLPVLAGRAVHCKYLATVDEVRKLNAGAYGYSQIGKCLVCYLSAQDDGLVTAMIDAVRPFANEGPRVPFARPLGGGSPLYYRYGSYRGTALVLGGQGLPDDRFDYEAAVPDGADDWLASHAGAEDEAAAFNSFLLRYPAYTALRQQGKSGIFLALNLASEAFQEVVLKVGYRQGQVQLDGSDGRSFLRHERRLYGELAARGLAGAAPAVIDGYDDGERVALVLECLPGPDLLTAKLAGTLTIDHLEQAWRLVSELHGGGLFLGDAKLANFLCDGPGVRVIDFESAGVLGVEPPPPLRTFDLRNPAVADLRAADLAHFLASVLFPYEDGGYSRRDRVADLAAYLDRTCRDDAERWAQSKLAALVAAV